MMKSIRLLERTFQRACRHHAGSSLVEFALVAMMFFVLVFGIIDFGRLFFVQMTVQHALREAGRFAVTGNHLPDPNDPSRQLSRVNSIMEVARQAAAGIDISSIQITSARGGTGNAGGPGDTVTVSLTTDLRLFTPLIAQFVAPSGVYSFTASTTFRNEPFPPSQTN